MKNVTVVLMMLVAIALFAYAGDRSPSTQSAASATDAKGAGSAKQEPAKESAQKNDRGAELFETHCGRCHKPPDDLSPRIAPAVLTHMRTRAMLSREDEEQLLKFLKP